MTVAKICIFLATVHCVFATEISDMKLSSSMLLERLEALEVRFESQRLQIADLVIKDKAQSDQVSDLEKLIADLTRQYKENTELKQQKEGIEIDHGLDSNKKYCLTVDNQFQH